MDRRSGNDTFSPFREKIFGIFGLNLRRVEEEGDGGVFLQYIPNGNSDRRASPAHFFPRRNSLGIG